MRLLEVALKRPPPWPHTPFLMLPSLQRASVAGAVCVMLIGGGSAAGAAGTISAAAARSLSVGHRPPLAANTSQRPPGGTSIWVARYTFKTGLDASGEAVAVSPDGRRVYVVGRSYDSRIVGGGHPVDYVTVAYDASTGAKIWVARYRTKGSNDPHGIAVSPDGTRVYVTGDDFDSETATVAYKAANGSQLWVARCSMSIAASNAIAVSRDGSKVYIIGNGSYASGSRLALVAYNANNGARAWTARYGSSVPVALALSPDGRTVYVEGGTGSFLTLAFDAATGARRWRALYKGQRGREPLGIAVSPDGSRVYVTGMSSLDTNGDSEYTTVAYDTATGSQLWLARYHDPYKHSLGDVADAIAVSPDGARVYVSGSSDDPPGFGSDYVTVAYSTKTGGQLWLTRYIQPVRHTTASVSALAASPDGTKVFVAGQTNPLLTTSSGQILAYDAATGRQLWLNRYTGPVNGASLNAVAVSRDGSKVYVTGDVGVSGSRPPSKGYLCLTIAYRTG